MNRLCVIQEVNTAIRKVHQAFSVCVHRNDLLEIGLIKKQPCILIVCVMAFNNC